MSQMVAITVIGEDRPGIVAGVTRSLYEAGCNLEDVSSTILRGHFAMMLIVGAPVELSAEDLEERLAPVAERMHLTVTVRPVREVDPEVPGPTHMVSVYGADRPGIVYRVAEVLAQAGVNVTDLNSRMIGTPDEPLYALMMEVAVTGERDLGADLQGVRDELGVEVTVHPIDADLL